MTAKGSGCLDHCCCSRCGVQLPPSAGNCCLCVCDTLCLEVREVGEGSCNCDVVFLRIPWSHAECAYSGTIVCGSLSIDVRFDIKKCSDGTCRLCLTSTCLELDGQCSSGTACNEFTSGGVNSDCGTYRRDCTQDGGWDETWNVNATGCLPPDTEISCPSITINVRCYDRVNPAGSGTTRKCKDCDCVCDCVTMSYEEVSAYQESKLVCWDGSWVHTFQFCPNDPQTVTVELVRDDDTGCCNWKVAITKGVFAEGYPGAGTTIALIKTDCPDIDIDLGIDLPGEDIGMLSIGCNLSCGDALCCPCGEFFLNIIQVPCQAYEVILKVSTLGGCILTETRDVTLDPNLTLTFTDCDSWRFAYYNNPISDVLYVDVSFRCVGESAEAFNLDTSISGISCDVTLPGTTTELICTECQFRYVVHVPIENDPGVCACEDDTLVIEITINKLSAPCV